MSMPSIPEGINRPNKCETVVDLLESIALEEMAIAHILNAEGEKIQAVVGKYSCSEISHEQLLNSCLYSNNVIVSLIMKEWLLFNKLSMVINFDDETEKKLDNKPCKNFSPNQFLVHNNTEYEKNCNNCSHFNICKDKELY